jgi:hypothetical protein
MNRIHCPSCDQDLAEFQVHAKPTKNKQYLKVRCLICRHAWKLPNPDFQAEAAPVEPVLAEAVPGS